MKTVCFNTEYNVNVATMCNEHGITVAKVELWISAINGTNIVTWETRRFKKRKTFNTFVDAYDYWHYCIDSCTSWCIRRGDTVEMSYTPPTQSLKEFTEIK